MTDPWASPPSTAWTLEDWRNLALIVGTGIAATVGTVLAIWRSMVLQDQANTAKRGLDFDRFQRGAAMLGDKRLSVREAGVITLNTIALKNQSDYLEPVFNLFCSFIRDRSNDEFLKHHSDMGTIDPMSPDAPDMPEDTHSALAKVIKLAEIKNNSEQPGLYKSLLKRSELENLSLSNFNLRKANLS